MEIAKHEGLLAISRKSPDAAHRVQIFTDQESLLNEWGWATRVSPIWGVKEHGTAEVRDEPFRGNRHLLFFGPVHPLVIANLCSRRSKLWLSLGLYNVVVLAASETEANRIKEGASDYGNGVPWEHWRIRNGTILSTNVSLIHDQVSENWREALVKISKYEKTPELRDVIREYTALVASAISKAERTAPELIPDFLKITEDVGFLLKRSKKESSKSGDQYRLFGQLLNINGGLSRFNSQTFAGTSLISDKECHFRYNSLLGVGTATLGLWRLRKFLDQRLGEGNIPGRVLALKNKPQPEQDLGRIPLRDPFWSTPHLDSINKSDLPHTSLVPLLAYFSARDGFRNTTSTISVPLASISGCNSLQWSLMTITHEVSHIVVHNVLAKILPDFNSEQSTRLAYELFTQQRSPSNLFEEFQRHFYLTLVSIDRLDNSDVEDDEEGIVISVDHEEFISILQLLVHEVEEIMVHVFDFMYFYGHTPKRYVPSIWISWGTIPTIRTRVNEYVIRTVCAVLAANFHRVKEPENWARKIVLELLKECVSQKRESRHIEQAIDYLKNEWDSEIKRKVKVRRELVKLVSAFMFSDQVATEVRGDASFHSRAADYEGYDLRKLFLDESTIENPLRFLELYATSSHPSPVESLWMFLVLSFCTSGT